VVILSKLIPLLETWMNPHTVIIYKVMSFKITIFYWQQTASDVRKRHADNWCCVFETILCSDSNALCMCVYHPLLAAVTRSVNYPPHPAPQYMWSYLAGTAGSILAGGMYVCLFWVVMSRPLLLVDHSFGGIVPGVLCLSVIVKPR